MDAEHRKLIGLFNDLDEVVQRGRPIDELIMVIEEVLDFTKQHFRSEEAHMERIGYVDLVSHKQAHEQLLTQVSALRDDAAEGSPAAISRFVIFFETWVVGHIIGIDKRYGQ